MTKRRKAFTLVELLTVIAVISILACVTVVGYSNLIKKAYVSNDMVLVEQLNKFVSLSVSDNRSLTNEEISEIIRASGIDDIDPQSQKYGYGFYFNTYSQRFELAQVDSPNIDDEHYVLINNDFLDSESKDDADSDKSPEDNGDVSEDRDDQSTDGDEGKNNEHDFVLECSKYEYKYQEGENYAYIEDGILNIGIKIEDDKIGSVELSVSDFEVKDMLNAERKWTVSYIIDGEDRLSSVTFDKCGRQTLSLMLTDESNVTERLDITALVRNCCYEDAEVTIYPNGYNVKIQGNTLYIDLEDFKESVYIMDYDIQSYQRSRNSLYDADDLIKNTKLEIVVNEDKYNVGVAKKIKNINEQYDISKYAGEDIDVTITVYYLGANGIEVNASVFYTNGMLINSK